MRTVVLTHAAADRRLARRLAERLAERAAIVWLDEARLEIGDSLPERTGDVGIRADAAVAIVSWSSIHASWMQNLASASPSVIPVVIDDVALPASLADGPRAAFGDPERFDASVEHLATIMGLGTGGSVGGSGLVVEWGDEGPRVSGRGIVIPPSEGRALLDGWRESLPEAVAREQERGTPPEEVGPAATLAALTRAFTDTCGRIPGGLELAAGTSELSRKFDVMYLFCEAMYGYAAGRGQR